MKFAGIIEPGIRLGIVTESRWVKGGYVVVEKREDLITIPEGVFVKGTPVYIAEEDIVLRFTGNADNKFIEEDTLKQDDLALINEDFSELRGYISNINSDIAIINTNLSTLSSVLNALEDEVSLKLNSSEFELELEKLVYKTQLSEVEDALSALINTKVDKMQGKGLSENDFTDELKYKLENLNNYDDNEIFEALENTTSYIDSNFYSKGSVDSLLNDSVEEVKEWVTDKNYLTEHQDISHKLDTVVYNTEKEGFATKDALESVRLKSAANEVKILGLDGEVLGIKAELDDIVIPTKVSSLENDAGYITEHQSLDKYALKSELFSKNYNDLTNTPAIPSKTTDLVNNSGFITKDVADLTNYYTKSTLYNKSEIDAKGYLTEHQSLDGYATEQFVTTAIGNIPGADLTNYYTKNEIDSKGYLTEHQSLDSYALKSELFSKDYNELLNKPTIPTVPTNISAFTNDVGYISEHQSIKTLNGQALVGEGDVAVVLSQAFPSDLATTGVDTPTFCANLMNYGAIDGTAYAGNLRTNDLPIPYDSTERLSGAEVHIEVINVSHSIIFNLELTSADSAPYKWFGIYWYSKQTDSVSWTGWKNLTGMQPEDLPENVSYFTNDAGYLNNEQTQTLINTSVSTKQDKLTAGDGIDITSNVISSTITEDSVRNMVNENMSNFLADEIEPRLGNKQDTLVSGTNIKTINGESVLGSGNIEVAGDTAYIENSTLVINDGTTAGGLTEEKVQELINNAVGTTLEGEY